MGATVEALYYDDGSAAEFDQEHAAWVALLSRLCPGEEIRSASANRASQSGAL